MAVGDRIGSARTAGFMRRINALENKGSNGRLYDYTNGTVTSSATFDWNSTSAIKRISRGGDYFWTLSDGDSVDGDKLVVISKDLSSVDVAAVGTTSYGGYQLQINIVDLCANANSGWALTQAQGSYTNPSSILKFGNDGDYEAGIEETTSDNWLCIGADSNNNCYAVERGTVDSLVKYNSSMVEQSSYTIDTTKTGNKSMWVDDDDVIWVNGYQFGASNTRKYNTSLTALGYLSTEITDRLVSTFSATDETVTTDGHTLSSGFGIQSYDDGSTIQSGIDLPTGRTAYSDIIIDTADYYGYAILHSGGGAGRLSKFNLAPPNLTTWYSYPYPGTDTGKVSLGIVDGGYVIPSTTAFVGLRPHYFELRDMRAAIESICTSYENPATSAAYTLSVDANNIFAISLGGLKTDWTTATVTHGSRIREDYYNDIGLVLTQLEGSALA